MRNLLDRLLSNRRASIIWPLVTAAAMYLLFVLFGQGENKMEWLILVPLVSLFWYWGVYFVFWIQLKNPMCPEKFLDFVELTALLFFGAGAVWFMLIFLLNPATGFIPTLCPAIITWSSIALLHGKRQ